MKEFIRKLDARPFLRWDTAFRWNDGDDNFDLSGNQAFAMVKILEIYRNFFSAFFKRCCIVTCFLLLVLWCESSPAATIKIGEINPLSGRFAKHGQETHQGVEVAVTETTSKAFVERFRRMFNRQPNTTHMHGYTSARALCGKASLAS